jgi:hypothetical protein
VIVMVLGIAFAAAQEKSGNFAWKAPEVGAGAFTDALGMLDREREEYATNLATYAVNLIARERASAASLDEARRYLALSLHLAPRNRRAIVANFQLSKGMVPEAVESDYSPEVLARLLFTRAQMLKQQGGGEDQLLARVFIELSAALDPRNEDAVYAAEVQRLDHGRVNWSDFTDVKREPREAAHEDGDSGSRP